MRTLRPGQHEIIGDYYFKNLGEETIFLMGPPDKLVAVTRDGNSQLEFRRPPPLLEITPPMKTELTYQQEGTMVLKINSDKPMPMEHCVTDNIEEALQKSTLLGRYRYRVGRQLSYTLVIQEL